MTMPIQIAKKKADEVVKALAPYCEKIMVVGSIRREKPTVHDIDIVLIPRDPMGLALAMRQAGDLKIDGAKIKQLIYQGESVDLYIASPETWTTLMLIRTGSKEHNIRLCALAKKKGWRLHADGEGLFDKDEKRIAGDTEASIFEALGVDYRVPQWR